MTTDPAEAFARAWNGPRERKPSMKSFTLIAIALLGLTGCTWISTETATILDFHPSGDAIDISLTKPDGTKLEATRSQGSSADVITATGDAVRPSLIP